MRARVPGEQGSGDPRPLTGARRLCRPARGRGGVGGPTLSRAHPRPLALAEAHALTLGSAGRGAAGCRCSLPLPSSCWPETHFASARHPRPAANSPRERTLRSGRRRPRHLRLDSRGARVRLPRAPRCLPPALSRGGGDRGGQSPRLCEVPLVKKKKISNTVHASDLL